jgi:hypothetical protein
MRQELSRCDDSSPDAPMPSVELSTSRPSVGPPNVSNRPLVASRTTSPPPVG